MAIKDILATLFLFSGIFFIAANFFMDFLIIFKKQYASKIPFLGTIFSFVGLYMLSASIYIYIFFLILDIVTLEFIFLFLLMIIPDNDNKIDMYVQFAPFIEGDSIGFPYEGLKSKFFKKNSITEFRNLYLFSDDTEHLILAKNALDGSLNVKDFLVKLKQELKIWMLTFPLTIGLTTLKSGTKLLLFFRKSGINSMGNGPIMRIPPIAFKFSNKDIRDEYIKTSNHITHENKELDNATFFLGDVLSYIFHNNRLSVNDIEYFVKNNFKKVPSHYDILIKYLHEKHSFDEFKNELKCNNEITGFIHNTIVFSIFSALTAPSKQDNIKNIIHSGGDVDTNLFLANGIYYYINSIKQKNELDIFSSVYISYFHIWPFKFLLYIIKRISDFIFIFYTLIVRLAAKIIS